MASFLTCPAPNAGVARRGSLSPEDVEEVLRERCAAVLAVAVSDSSE